MTIYLVRHAKAGSRDRWEGDDALRPLSGKGREQARRIGEALAGEGVTALVSSPYVRCVQTLEPLGERCDLEVVPDARLAEETPFEQVLDLLAEVPDGAVLCSHGDVIPDTMAALERRGCRIDGRADWRKATVWRLERDADGSFVAASVTPPPD
ncbi:MAG: phosphoglycerate mutase family protein [Acidimicrobiales bacterium]